MGRTFHGIEIVLCWPSLKVRPGLIEMPVAGSQCGINPGVAEFALADPLSESTN